MQPPTGGTSLADILERVLDRGVVIAGDITVSLVEIELLTIKLRLVVASVDRAREIGIDWWENDPALSSAARRLEDDADGMHERLARLERLAGIEARAPDSLHPTAGPALDARPAADRPGRDLEPGSDFEEDSAS
ncbi:MAG: gas vesicle protein [Kiloniellales bacterium]|nr:gas vesicle protein [Kiloniellales bacterium]